MQPQYDSASSENPIHQVVEEVCQSVTPVWPLDQFIAVNPWWKLTHLSLAEVAAQLASRSGAQVLMPRHFYRQCYERGEIKHTHLQQVAKEYHGASPEKLLAHISTERHTHECRLVSHLVDSGRDLTRNIAWVDEITHQISQFCAAYFDQHQAKWKVTTDTGLYNSWLNTVRHDRGIGLLMGEPDIHTQFAGLPEDYRQLWQQLPDMLDLQLHTLHPCLHALSLSINGWASWCAYQQQESERQGQQSEVLQELLAIRAAWECVLYHHYHSNTLLRQWQLSQQQVTDYEQFNLSIQQYDWLWQQALELAYQQRLFSALKNAPVQCDIAQPKLQAVFCIDVRSEPYRRALESLSSDIQTKGFAGFFGLAAEYQPQGCYYRRPQLPGLLSPDYRLVESGLNEPVYHRLSIRQAWQRFKHAAPSAFTFVETSGPAYGLKLFRQSFAPRHQPNHPVTALSDGNNTPLQLVSCKDPEHVLDVVEKTGLAAKILTGMGLTDGFAETILLVGHGSESHNNPHAAGLDCGACGGQTGEVNSKALATILNNIEVREELRHRGIEIPLNTRFVAALHNTTTDEVKLFSAAEDTKTQQVQQWLQQASELARQQRVGGLMSESDRPGAGQLLRQAFLRRSYDWSQVRPEWGLANNASFIVAPRWKTKGVDLNGRAFLHDYDSAKDDGFQQLEQIMTAPMLVTHWINFQYYASVTDNPHYGSGNKVLHNVVGGNIGVFEGNGGDLRTGLAMQSVHDGQRWVHQPLRLSVVIDAPQQAIADIVIRHPQIKHLVDNQWLYLFSGLKDTCRYLNGKWIPFPTAEGDNQ
ncbi:YbcC family protein [Lacimicrobium alkaliphilum]|uniref:Probable inorganic carbon transporter subunit DabA n=1 Tax=Lacimicrobium alkaliphilum TaxID=1526571 RepID=A0ABQ1RF57_9ALTE|nr:DUF2309 domain-containing protein [Lacimicrobium alkaliphilum]GGD68473.1 UPF0753 protein [Lacimicrobium alkaliphilum]